MNAFLEWPGWAGVSGIAQVLALLAVVGAIWRLLRARGQVPMFFLDVSVIGVATLSDGKRFHTLQFHNTGRSSAEVHIVECIGGKVRLEDGYVAPKTLAAGDMFQLLVTAPKLSDVWFRVTWRTPDVRRRVTVGWWPVASGDIDTAWRKDAKSWYFYRRAFSWLTQREVGPRHGFRGWHHAWPWENMHKLTPPPKNSVLYSLGSHHNFSPKDIPFEDPIR